MKNPIKLALILVVLTGGGLAAQRQFITTGPGRKAFDAAYNRALDAHMTSKFREAETSYLAALKEAGKLPESYGAKRGGRRGLKNRPQVVQNALSTR